MRTWKVQMMAGIGFGVWKLMGFLIAAGMLWYVWNQATRPVVDSWMETGTVISYEERLEGGSRRKPNYIRGTRYVVDVRTSDGEVVRVSGGKRKPTIGRRVKVQWVEYEDGSVHARFPSYNPETDPYSLNNI